MDVKLPPKKWYVKYRIHIVAGILAAGLIGMLIKVSTGPKIIRINSDSVQTATVQSGEFSEYVNAEGTLQPIQTIKVYTREGGFVEICVTGKSPDGYRTPYRYKLADLGKSIFFTPREAAELAQRETERYERTWSRMGYPPMRRTWEVYL